MIDEDSLVIYVIQGLTMTVVFLGGFIWRGLYNKVNYMNVKHNELSDSHKGLELDIAKHYATKEDLRDAMNLMNNAVHTLTADNKENFRDIKEGLARLDKKLDSKADK